jgi:predicted nuclease with TOPRIM domain
MKEAIEQRLSELKKEFESGQKMMAELESKKAALREQLLRISGAIRVLEELSGEKPVVSEAPDTAEANGSELPELDAVGQAG